ncbi:MAG: zinc ribbon domain-containing protein [Lachnospiraceae bacterium]|nr:zinc ribbon domain-containing protein [Lachnospiraceae bacterium]
MMAIFDDFGKKVTQMGQGAVAKAKNMTDQAKLHGQINEEEKKIGDSYRKIGELFYGVRGGRDLPEYQVLMDEIDATKERIEELKHQLQVAKGMVICPECGAEVSINATFCPNCGTKMPQPAPKAEEPQDEPADAEPEEAAEVQSGAAEPEEAEEPQDESAGPEEATEAADESAEP